MTTVFEHLENLVSKHDIRLNLNMAEMDIKTVMVPKDITICKELDALYTMCQLLPVREVYMTSVREFAISLKACTIYVIYRNRKVYIATYHHTNKDEKLVKFRRGAKMTNKAIAAILKRVQQNT